MKEDAPPPRALYPEPHSLDARWHQSHYVVKERRFTLGRQYRIFDGAGTLVAYCKQRMFKLREDIRFFTDESQQVELFRLQATKVIDWNGNFEVIDSSSGQRLGLLRRKGWKSLLRDEWHVFDAWEQPWGVLKEDTKVLAALRRILTFVELEWAIPYEYRLHRESSDESRPVATIRERFQLFGDTYDVDVGPESTVDARVLLGLAVCVDAIEGE